MHPEPLTVEVITSEEALAALEPEWLALERSSGNTLPFRTATWALCWWKHMREARLALADSLAMRAVRAADGRLVGVAPLILTERPAVGPFRARCLHLIGADPNMTEIRGALSEPDLEAACYAAIREDLTRSLGELDWVRWTGVDGRHGAIEALGVDGVRWSDGVACYVVDLPSTWEELRSSRPSNLRESLRKGYRYVQREGLVLSFEVVTTALRTSEAVHDFLRLHTARAALEGTVPPQRRLRAPRLPRLPARRVRPLRGARRAPHLPPPPRREARRVARRLRARRLPVRLLLGRRSGVREVRRRDDPRRGGHPARDRRGAHRREPVHREGPLEGSGGVPGSLVFREAWILPSSPLGRAKYQAFRATERAIVGSSAGRYARRLLSRRPAQTGEAPPTVS